MIHAPIPPLPALDVFGIQGVFVGKNLLCKTCHIAGASWREKTLQLPDLYTQLHFVILAVNSLVVFESPGARAD